MLKIFLIVLLVLIHFTGYAQSSSDYLLPFSDKTSGEELYGFKSRKGKVIIKPKYEIVGTAKMYHIALVTYKFKWIAINRKDSVLLSPYIYDNGPDELREGLFRFEEHGLIGFANNKGQKIIPARFECVSFFVNGLAAFNVGGHAEYRDPEHPTWEGGLWGFIDKTGVEVIPPQFAGVLYFEQKYAEAWTKDKKHVLIDKKGKIRKILSQ
ncbi:WG repeat-containing protein [Dyadobacter luticola]|uniref:WG repeat-containing protein n=1 Tax=Dyadobacter luticola TaxID=1979387 RepID=A0A5R9L1J9_9BACT|nr:WG repeat-containing protein [Dyadobacter luticola]TLV02229.1 WG repeat-containing protein [Dyadobacter luticola]